MKTVLVTGATQGIGLHTALRLAQAGHNVVLHGRTAESGEAALARIRSESGARKEDFSLVTGDLSDLMQVRFEEWGGQESRGPPSPASLVPRRAALTPPSSPSPPPSLSVFTPDPSCAGERSGRPGQGEGRRC